MNSTQIDRVFDILKNTPVSSPNFYFIFQGLGYVANAQPFFFDEKLPLLTHFVVDYQNLQAMICLEQYFVASTILRGEKAATDNLSILIDLLKTKTNITNEIRSRIFHSCQLIGVIDKQALKAKRSDLTAFDSHSECRMLIDFIDGSNQNEECQEAINRTRDEVAQMQKRVIKTEYNIQNVNDIVARQELKVSIDSLFNPLFIDILEIVRYRELAIKF